MSVRRNPNLGLSPMRARRRRLFWVRFYIIVFFVFLIIFGLAILSSHEKMIVKTFLISGNNSISNNEILRVANQDMVGRYFGLFAKSNFLIFPRFKIKQDLLNEFRIIDDLDISWKSWQTVAISITERKPHSVWCGLAIKGPVDDCYFIDEHGYIFGRAPTFSGTVFIKNYGPYLLNSNESTSTPNPIGHYFLKQTDYSNLFVLRDILSEKSLNVNSIYFDGFDFRFTLTNGVVLIFNDRGGGLAVAFQNLFTVINSGDLDLIKGSNDIVYIDLRFTDKIVIGKK